MDVIYKVPRKAYLTPLALVGFALLMGIMPFLVRLITEIDIQVVACFAVFCFIMAGFSLLFGIGSFFYLRRTYIKINPTQIEITMSGKTITLLWSEVQAYYQNRDDAILFASQGFLIPLSQFAETSQLAATICAYLPRHALTQDALETAFPLAKTYRELVEHQDFTQTVSISLWQNVIYLPLFIPVILLASFISPFFSLLALIIIWIMSHPQKLTIDIHGLALQHGYRYKFISWQEINIAELPFTKNWTFRGDNNYLTIPGFSHWQGNDVARKELVTYLHAQLWEQKITVRYN